MQRLEIFPFTGSHAHNEKVARRINRKARSLLGLRQTVLIDFDRVTAVEDAFFATALDLPALDQVKVCGLTPTQRERLLDARVSFAAETIVR